jgi:MerR family transcriptional regulator, light-induced transcriptional regulator
MDLQTAADRLGVHYQTAYRWVRDGSLAAAKVGPAYEVSEDELARFSRKRARPLPPPHTTKVRSWTAQMERLYATLRDGDELAARRVVDRLHEGGVAPLDLCEQLFAPALRRLGDDWAAGRTTVAEGHRASAICDRLLVRCAVHPRGRPRGSCIVATAPGELHGLPALMASIVLRADRWQVHHLGTQVPPAELAALMAASGATTVVLSHTNADAAASTKDAAKAVARAGGRALVGRPGSSLRELLAAARGTLS